jgi:hypothetical protein
VAGGGGVRTLVRVALPGATRTDPALVAPLDETDVPPPERGLPAPPPPWPSGRGAPTAPAEGRPGTLRPIDP